MKSYLILVRGGNEGFAQLDEAGQGALFQKWGEYMKKLTDSGNWVNGAPLERSGRIVFQGKEAIEGVVGDGEESIGGYMTLSADSYDAAIKLCNGCPSLDIGSKLEVREISEM